MDLCVRAHEPSELLFLSKSSVENFCSCRYFSAFESEYPPRCNIHFIRLISVNAVQLHLMKTVN